MPTAVLSTKGQIVIPREVREQQGLVPGTTFEVEVDDGCVVLRPVREVRATTLEELIGCTGYVGPRKTLEQMEQGIAEGVRRQP